MQIHFEVKHMICARIYSKSNYFFNILYSISRARQFSSEAVRGLVEDSVIPYTSNQKGVGLLRVKRRFRTHGPEMLVAEYHKRPMAESAFSYLKTQYGLTVNKVRRLANVSVYALLSVLCHVLVREATENMGRP